MKQRILAFGDDFDVRDESGKKVYFIDGKAYSFGEDLALRDTSKNEVARIKQKLFTFFPTYTIHSKSQLLATVRKKPFSFRTRFSIDVPGPDDFEVIGNMFRYDYTISQDKREVAKVSKKILSMTDSYGIEIKEPSQSILLLCA
ncbi:MAG: LURP-one-related family protein, partial [Bdellovibrionales bacterium]|nr:LURP-one-related family protein [Bdellovibrionales bacterium]